MDRIGRALQKLMKTADWKKGIWIPMASTYLNQRRWEDAEELPDAPEEPPAEEGRSNVRWI